MKTALIAVDIQYDFLPDGALAVPEGDRVIHPLCLAARECDLVIASRDWHPKDHISFSEWPPHCVQHTRGARIHPQIRKLANYTVSKGFLRDVQGYSAFTGQTLRPSNTLEVLLRKNGVQRLIVGGLALDYCVRWTALDGNALGFDTIVPLDCTRGIDLATSGDAVSAFERAGVRVVDHWSW